MTLDEKARLIDGPVGRQLVSLALPMLGGIFAMVAFHLADTYFVSRLDDNTEVLAAMGFIGPVVMLVHGIAMGMGIATASVVSRAIGAGDQTQVRRLTTHAAGVRAN